MVTIEQGVSGDLALKQENLDGNRLVSEVVESGANGYIVTGQIIQ